MAMRHGLQLVRKARGQTWKDSAGLTAACCAIRTATCSLGYKVHVAFVQSAVGGEQMLQALR